MAVRHLLQRRQRHASLCRDSGPPLARQRHQRGDDSFMKAIHSSDYPYANSLVNHFRIARLGPSYPNLVASVMARTKAPKRKDNRPAGAQEWRLPEGVEPDSLAGILARNLWNLMNRAPDLQSQLGLAGKAGVGQATISRILDCSGTVRLVNVEKVARAFGIDAWLLLHPDPARALRGVEFYAKMRQEFAEGSAKRRSMPMRECAAPAAAPAPAPKQ